MHWPWHIPTRITDDANAAAERLGLPATALRGFRCGRGRESFVAPGYGLPSPARTGRRNAPARHNGSTVDRLHVYTAKALAALVADVRAGKYPRGSALVFIHTGGVPAIFAEPEKVLAGDVM